MNYKKIVFDLDDTLWDLNKRVCKRANIEPHKITTFLMTDNPNLTEEQKKAILSSFANPEVWNNIEWSRGAKSIRELEALGYDVYVNSNCMNEEVASLKRELIHSELGLPYDHIIVGIAHDPTKKKIDSDTYIFVDDSPYNIASSTATYTLVPNKSWNKSVINENTQIIRFNSLSAIIRFIKQLEG